ncbi:hypothetical protein PybrP1_005773 [[Pythium] brassicae (nom. inval.)]|nr:hypothetical protein PybrP1_005773 [[Pythium] brassicae (nom. inval.)]
MRPSKTTIMRIIKSAPKLRELPAEQLEKRRASPAHTVLLNITVVGFLVHTTVSNAAVSSCKVIAVGMAVSQALAIPAAGRPRFTRAGWVRHLLARYGIRSRCAYGESASVDPEMARVQAKRVREKIRRYHRANVYNIYETAILYEAPPLTSLCLAPNDIGYVSTARDWMTAAVYQQWLRDLDRRMAAEGRNILVLVDNAPSHKQGELALTDVTIAKLPPNTPTLLQPMVHGAIAALKRGFVKRGRAAAVRVDLDGRGQPYDVSHS